MQRPLPGASLPHFHLAVGVAMVVMTCCRLCRKRRKFSDKQLKS